MKKTNLYWVEMSCSVSKYFAKEIEAETEEQARVEATSRFGKAYGFRITKIKKQFA